MMWRPVYQESAPKFRFKAKRPVAMKVKAQRSTGIPMSRQHSLRPSGSVKSASGSRSYLRTAYNEEKRQVALTLSVLVNVPLHSRLEQSSVDGQIPEQGNWDARRLVLPVIFRCFGRPAVFGRGGRVSHSHFMEKRRHPSYNPSPFLHGLGRPSWEIKAFRYGQKQRRANCPWRDGALPLALCFDSALFTSDSTASSLNSLPA